MYPNLDMCGNAGLPNLLPCAAYVCQVMKLVYLTILPIEASVTSNEQSSQFVWKAFRDPAAPLSWEAKPSGGPFSLLAE